MGGRSAIWPIASRFPGRARLFSPTPYAMYVQTEGLTAGLPSHIPTVKVRTNKTKAQIRYLLHDIQQQKAVAQLYESSLDDFHSFTKGDPASQLQAQELLRSLHLDANSRANLESRWSVRWSNSWTVDNGSDRRRRTLFQCACGYDPEARQIFESKKPSSTTSTAATWDRRVPYGFTGCLAHVEVIERCSDGEVSRIGGYFAHNAECQSAILSRLPAVPLHDHVFEVALHQLEEGASITAIQARNREMIDKKLYRDIQSQDPKSSNVRYHLLPSDNTSLYRKFSRQHGVDTRRQPQYNIDDWLNPSSPNYRQEIADAIFYYRGRSDAGERFKVCISTPEMKDAAWKYAHHSQLVLDGTFGICTSRLLLFIALARDEHGKGVPLAFFLFSAPTGNRATHAGYNTDILEELIREWKDHLGVHPVTGEHFEPYVAITDTDTKERGALLRVWATICLLLCKFHLRQCWTNHRKTALRVKGSDYWKDFIVNSLRSLETQLIATIDHAVALGLIAHYRTIFDNLAADTSRDSCHAAKGGIKHLDYLLDNWMVLPLWQSWSEWGRLMASSLLKIPVEGVIPTTNHLESFNAILKRKHLAIWLHSGHRLRFDFLINILITRILPGIYSHRRSQQDYKDWLATRFSEHSGSANLAEIHAGLSKERVNRPICWWKVDPIRDAAAEQIIQNRLLYIWRLDGNTYLGRCYSSAPLHQITITPEPVIYEIYVYRSGQARCSCQDFISRGGACKHLRAVRVLVEGWIAGGQELAFMFPKSLVEAEKLCQSDSTKTDAHLDPQHHHTSSAPAALVTPPLKLGLSFDPVLVQSLGDDRTTLDDQEIGSTEEENAYQESDSDSYDLGDSGSPRNCSKPHASTEILGVDRRTVTSNESAISGQLQRRLEYDVKRVLPSLHGIANILSDASHLTLGPDLQEFSGLLTTIQDHLAAEGSNTGCRPSSRPVTPKQTRVRYAPYARRLLMPPSPEKRQKRKDSHAPM